MAQSPLERFRTWLEQQGVPAPDAVWLTDLCFQLGRRLRVNVGLGAQQEDGRTWIYFHVPGREEGLRFDLASLKPLEDPVGELTDLIRKRLLT